MKNIKSIIATSVLSGFLGFFVALSLSAASPVYADPPVNVTCPDGSQVQVSGAVSPDRIEGACENTAGGGEQKNPSPLGDYRAPTGDRDPSGGSICGNGGEGGKNEVKVAFDFGCRGLDYPGDINPIVDILFALFRFLSVGVGLVVIGSIIVAGIQYSTSRGNPQSTQAAIKRIVNSVAALFMYIFIFAIANFLIPGGMF